ncbi:hypothetical protein JXA32_02680 [Candidatus Sumerlaeota bacterium]|nr:hypothetical protein [Candidatus Sumerlaeota bacterium]
MTAELENPPHLQRHKARRLEFYWLCGLILSFAYELPLWQPTPYDRVNPRLFDVMFLIGVVGVLPHLRHGIRVSWLFRIWASIVGVFCFCATVWTIAILPWEYGQFSLFFAAKYIEGLIVIYIGTQIPLDARQKKIIHQLIVCGGVFVALYAIPQYGSKPTEWAISGGKTVKSFEGAIFGPLSRTYFHIGLFSVLSFAMTLTLVPSIRSVPRSWLCLGLAFFVAWPALACGSRAAIAGTAIVLLVSVWLKPMLMRKSLVFAIMAACFVYLAGFNVRSFDANQASLGFKRFEIYRNTENSIMNRIRFDYSIDRYMFDGLPVPFIGAGFYVAPISEGLNSLRYRVGYGIHNSYFFAFEQGGTAAFVLFLLFLACGIHRLNKMRKSRMSVDVQFALGLYAYMVFVLINGFAGQGFWRGFGTGNFNTYVILLLIIATQKINALNVITNEQQNYRQKQNSISMMNRLIDTGT